MKKMILMILFASFVFLFVGCGQVEETKSSQTAQLIYYGTIEEWDNENGTSFDLDDDALLQEVTSEVVSALETAEPTSRSIDFPRYAFVTVDDKEQTISYVIDAHHIIAVFASGEVRIRALSEDNEMYTKLEDVCELLR